MALFPGVIIVVLSGHKTGRHEQQHNSLIKRVIEEHYMVDHEVSTLCRKGYWEILLCN